MGDGERADALRIAVTPAPDEEEAAAVVAALAVLRATRRRDGVANPPPRLSQWALAGRLAAMRGLGEFGMAASCGGGWRRRL